MSGPQRDAAVRALAEAIHVHFGEHGGLSGHELGKNGCGAFDYAGLLLASFDANPAAKAALAAWLSPADTNAPTSSGAGQTKPGAAIPAEAIGAEERKYTEADMEGEYQMGYREGLEAARPANETICGNDEWDRRYECTRPAGHEITGPRLTSHDYHPKNPAPSTPAGDGLREALDAPSAKLARAIGKSRFGGTRSGHFFDEEGWQFLLEAVKDARSALTASQPRNEDGLDVERLDRAMAAAGIHVDAARPGPTREVGCSSCRKGVQKIAAEYAAQGGEAAGEGAEK